MGKAIYLRNKQNLVPARFFIYIYLCISVYNFPGYSLFPNLSHSTCGLRVRVIQFYRIETIWICTMYNVRCTMYIVLATCLWNVRRKIYICYWICQWTFEQGAYQILRQRTNIPTFLFVFFFLCVCMRIKYTATDIYWFYSRKKVFPLILHLAAYTWAMCQLLAALYKKYTCAVNESLDFWRCYPLSRSFSMVNVIWRKGPHAISVQFFSNR